MPAELAVLVNLHFRLPLTDSSLVVIHRSAVQSAVEVSCMVQANP